MRVHVIRHSEDAHPMLVIDLLDSGHEASLIDPGEDRESLKLGGTQVHHKHHLSPRGIFSAAGEFFHIEHHFGEGPSVPRNRDCS